MVDEEAPIVHSEFLCWLACMQLVVLGRHASSIEELRIYICLCGRQHILRACHNAGLFFLFLTDIKD